MDKDTLNNVVRAVLSAVLKKDLVDCINQAIDNGDDVEVAVEKALKIVQLKVGSAPISTPSSSNKVTAKASTSKTAKKDPLKDDNGHYIKCCATKKSDGSQCNSNAREEHNGMYYCGTHIRSAQKVDKPAKEKKPSFDKSNHKSSSSFETVLNEVDEVDDDIGL